jgi:hypothetical protein
MSKRLQEELASLNAAIQNLNNGVRPTVAGVLIERLAPDLIPPETAPPSWILRGHARRVAEVMMQEVLDWRALYLTHTTSLP